MLLLDFFSAVADFALTHIRSTAVSFLNPIQQYTHGIFIENPSGSYNFTAFSDPFHYLVWIAVLGLIVFTPIVLYLTVR